MLEAAGCEHIDDTLRLRNSEGNICETTALVQSSLKGHTEVVELLIGAKADVNKCNEVDFGEGIQPVLCLFVLFVVLKICFLEEWSVTSILGSAKRIHRRAEGTDQGRGERQSTEYCRHARFL